MSENTSSSPYGEPTGSPAPQASYAAPPPPPGGQLSPYGTAQAVSGPLGEPRSAVVWILLSIVTLGIAGIIWAFKNHEEIKLHTGEGIGGVAGFLLWMILPIVSMFVLPNEIEKMYGRAGQQSPITTMCGLWIFVPFVGFLIWWFKVQGALNDYWVSQGAPA